MCETCQHTYLVGANHRFDPELNSFKIEMIIWLCVPFDNRRMCWVQVQVPVQVRVRVWVWLWWCICLFIIYIAQLHNIRKGHSSICQCDYSIESNPMEKRIAISLCTISIKWIFIRYTAELPANRIRWSCSAGWPNTTRYTIIRYMW